MLGGSAPGAQAAARIPGYPCASLAEADLHHGRKDFEQAVRAHGADLYRFAYWLCRDRHTAEDIVQEACLRAWKSWSSLRELSQAKAWLLTIVRNEVSRRAPEATRARQMDRLDDDELPAMPSFEPGLEASQIVASLPPLYREPLLLQVLGGFSCAEIAVMLGTSEGAVMTRLTRARQALRRELAEPKPTLRVAK